MSKKPKYQLKPWEGTGSKSDTTANITVSMMTSPAWFDLSPQQKALYLACKAQLYAEKKKPGEILEQFTMNRSKWADLYHLYTRDNAKGFYRDMLALIEHGFIECVFSGKLTRTKSVYRYCAMWQKWGTPEFSVSPAAKPMTRPAAAPISSSQEPEPAADQLEEKPRNRQRERITQEAQAITAAALEQLEDSTGPADHVLQQAQEQPTEAEKAAAQLKAQRIAALKATM